jgi:RimJ/RimL family protein N-acetyltransferase
MTGPPLPLPLTLQTSRLLLRPWAEGDETALQAALGESVEQLLPWIPWATAAAPTSGESRALVQRWIGEREAGVNCIYAMFERAGSRLAGGVGLYNRVGPGALEIGYWVRTAAAGTGYATEASAALTSAGFALPGIERIEIHIDPRNLPSRRVPEKLGFSLLEIRGSDRERGGAATETMVFVLPRSGFEAARRSGPNSRK